MGKYRVSMGIGGTFTDLIALDEQNGEELKKSRIYKKIVSMLLGSDRTKEIIIGDLRSQMSAS